MKPIEIINEFVNNVKDIFTSSCDGSEIVLDYMENRANIRASMRLSNPHHGDTLAVEINMLEQKLSEAEDKVPFLVIIKRSAGKTLIKNTLSPKNQQLPRQMLTDLFKKYDMVLLDHLVEDDPKWLGEILEERYKRSQNDDILLMITYLSQL